MNLQGGGGITSKMSVRDTYSPQRHVITANSRKITVKGQKDVKTHR